MTYTIKPYRLTAGPYAGAWAFDDEAAELVAEPFVCGVSEMLDAFLEEQGINPDDRGFELRFSAEPFGIGCWKKLVWESAVDGGNWYCSYITGKVMRGWLCPALYKYFDVAPKTIYVSVVGT
jgi:hypothetical protein